MLSDADGQRGIAWAFLFWGSRWEDAQREVWPAYFAAMTARNNESRDVAAEEKLFALMQRYTARLGRRLEDGADVYDVLAVRDARPKWIVFRNLEAYALVVQSPDATLDITGAIQVGAALLDERIVLRALFEAA